MLEVESETTDLWQSKWNENQTVLGVVKHTWIEMQIPWKAQRLGAGV